MLRPFAALVAQIIALSFFAGASMAQQEAGLVLVMDYSSSMWAPTNEDEPGFPGQPRLSPDDGVTTYRMHDRAEQMASLLIARKLDFGFNRTTRIVTFGDSRPGDCTDITVQRGLGDRMSPDMARNIERFFRATGPRGRTPLQRSIERAISLSEQSILSGAEERFEIVVYSDMRDVCDGDEYIERPTENVYCDIGKALQASLQGSNARIVSAKGIEDGITISYVVELNAAANLVDGRSPFAWLRDCFPSLTVLTPRNNAEAEETARQIARRPERPAAPLPIGVNVVGAPPSQLDSFGRDVNLLPAQLDVIAPGGGIISSERLTASGADVSAARNATVEFAMRPLEGKEQRREHLFVSPETIAFDLSLPTLAFQLLTSEGLPVAGTVNWTLRDLTRDPVDVQRTSNNTISFDVPAGLYEIVARQGEREAARRTIEVLRNDLLIPLEVAAPAAPARITLPLRVVDTQTSLALGSPEAVDFRLVGVRETISVPGPRGTAEVLADQTYDIEARVDGETIVKQRVFITEDEAPNSVELVLPPARIFGNAVDSGVWTLIEIENDQFAEVPAQLLDETVLPGRYQVVRSGATLCPSDEGVRLGYGDLLEIAPAQDWPIETCQ